MWRIQRPVALFQLSTRNGPIPGVTWFIANFDVYLTRMCGIAGFLNFDNGYELALKANSIQRHRGPDHQGVWSDDWISLCNQRLSIIDLNDRSNQPFIKGDWVIVYNGELYNYQQLRSGLSSRYGVNFQTDSDTEVVLEMYLQHGKTCLDHFLGMFAFAICNRVTRKLFLARDHFGIKPLFYLHRNDQLAFASELKTLLEIPGLTPVLNKSSVLQALNFSWLPGEETMIQGIRKLPPAHYVEISNPPGAMQPRAYWKAMAEISQQDEDQCIEELDSALQRSVQRHMVADVPVSAFLSGGLDSSLISVLAKKYNAQLSTFTIATRKEDKRIEQMPADEIFAAELAQSHGFDHHEILLEPNISSELPSIVRSLDEPIGDPAAINTRLICQAARAKGVKVLLSGMGADEIFFGYRRQKATLLAARFQSLPGFIRKPVEVMKYMPVKVMGRGFKLGRWSKRFAAFANSPPPQAYMRSFSYYDSGQLQNLLSWSIREDLIEMGENHDRVFCAHYPDDLINKMCFTDLHYFLPGLNLTYTDRASMATSVEVRVPFVDKEVIELAMRIPGSLKYKNGQSKYILKRVAERHLDKKFVHRPKASFGAPIRSWMSNELSEMTRDLLSPEAVRNRGIFNSDPIQEMIKRDRNGSDDFAYQLYQLLTMELWFREFLH